MAIKATDNDADPPTQEGPEAARPNWKYEIEYVDKDGVVVHDRGSVRLSTATLVYKYVSAKYREKSMTGFFRSLKVVEIDKDGNEIGDPTDRSIVEQVTDAASSSDKAVFDKKPCFVYQYVGQLVTQDMKQHKFYEVVPHY